MLNFKNFINNRKLISKETSQNYFELDGIVNVYSYEGFEIGPLDNDKCYLIINTEEHTGTLIEIESILFSWYKENNN